METAFGKVVLVLAPNVVFSGALACAGTRSKVGGNVLGGQRGPGEMPQAPSLMSCVASSELINLSGP